MYSKFVTHDMQMEGQRGKSAGESGRLDLNGVSMGEEKPSKQLHIK